MTIPFSLPDALSGAPTVTRDGRPGPTQLVKFEGLQADSHALRGVLDGRIASWSIDGCWYHASDPTGNDLFMAPTKRSGWINIYPRLEDACLHATKEQAEREADAHLVACVFVEWTEP